MLLRILLGPPIDFSLFLKMKSLDMFVPNCGSVETILHGTNLA